MAEVASAQKKNYWPNLIQIFSARCEGERLKPFFAFILYSTLPPCKAPTFFCSVLYSQLHLPHAMLKCALVAMTLIMVLVSPVLIVISA